MKLSGLLEYVTKLPFTDLHGFALSAIVSALALVISTFMSNTATANLIIPAAMALSAAAEGQLAILTALACSFALAMPVSTPPNAIAFATGRIPVGDIVA